LKVIRDELNVKSDEGKLKGQSIEVWTLNKIKVKELVEEWYRLKAKEKLNQIANPLFDKFVFKHNLSLITYRVSLRSMPT